MIKQSQSYIKETSNVNSLSRQRAVVAVTLSQIKGQVREVNKAKLLYEKLREERNRLLYQYIRENDFPETAYNLAYELKITPATIYNIKSQMEDKANGK